MPTQPTLTKAKARLQDPKDRVSSCTDNWRSSGSARKVWDHDEHGIVQRGCQRANGMLVSCQQCGRCGCAGATGDDDMKMGMNAGPERNPLTGGSR
jgi:hypothetical protein